LARPLLFEGYPQAARILLMMDAFQVLAFGLAIGFVISGIVSNLFGLLTDGQSMLHFPVTSDARRLMIVGLLIFAGPHILLRAANRALRLGDWPPAYTFTCFGLCTLWSFVVGFAVLKIFVL
jgi:hypothetical protein